MRTLLQTLVLLCAGSAALAGRLLATVPPPPPSPNCGLLGLPNNRFETEGATCLGIEYFDLRLIQGRLEQHFERVLGVQKN